MPKEASSRWLFITVPDSISKAQVFPFFFHAADLRADYGIELREITLKAFSARAPYANQVDVVCFQTWFDISPGHLADLMQQLKRAYTGARLIYFDWFAPTDLRFAEPLDREIEFYVKKHVLRDRTAYQQPTLGDTNLTDYYSRRHGPALGLVSHNIPDAFWEKLVIGPNFAFSPELLPLLLRTPSHDDRKIDVHARIAVGGTPWYAAMRGEALAGIKKVTGLHIVDSGKISRKAYFSELASSRICFSPFGYGEVCWRDFEAILSGALLVKPDMAHIESCPDIFLPFQTYVPIRWDLADLEEKLHYYIDHPDERIAIAERGLAVLRDYFARGGFLDQIKPLLRKMTPVASPPISAPQENTI